jgi:hypothetical protein
LTASWLPAFVAPLGGFGLLVVWIGSGWVGAWLVERDPVGHVVGMLLLLIVTMVDAFVLPAALPST